ncbi:GAF domain-containing SpoIIE family protein phosphatase [Peptostreptococcus faecalis]|uniref:GAF domain-containing SpoIIE family protein phosphatase n=1 Tax=Peptostreptococcus faecalis TaxID=2045015 RepID=UPI000C7DE77C|nr:GAF domain-containing SpoIIE family protein phosphatase [Peptostreptococcus faecalis]
MSYVEKMKNLVEITKLVTESDNFFDIKDSIINTMLNVVDPTKACVNLFYGNDYNYAHLVCSATLDYIPKIFPKNEEHGSKIDFNVYPEYIHKAVDEGKIIVIEDVSNDETAKGESLLAINEGYKGRAVFPFIINNKTVGFMTCYLDEDDTLDNDDIDFISQVASLMSLSISITEKNNGIKNLINKLRNSLTNLNKASRRLYSTEDMFYYLKKMTSILVENTNSEYALMNVYNVGKKGEVQGQKVSISEPFHMINNLNSLMPMVMNSSRVSEFNNDADIVLPNGKNVKKYLFFKYLIDSKTALMIMCVGGDDFSTDDESTVSVLARQVSLSIQSYEYSNEEKKQKDIDNELSLLKVQRELIMSDDNIKKYQNSEFFFYRESAKVVGGDFYHAIDMGEKIVFIVADVMGHGVISNYIVAIIKGAFDVLAKSSNSPKDILLGINNFLYDEFDKMGIYSTAIIGFLYKSEKKIVLSSAGHYFPIVVDKDNNVIKIDTKKRELPVGIIKDANYSDLEYDISNFKLMCFFTDGILEMKNANDDEYGEDRLENFIVENVDKDKIDILDNLKLSIESFVYKEEKKDDILVLFIK